MKKQSIVIVIMWTLVNCIGVDDSCLDPDCSRSQEMRFNLIDNDGVDLVFDSTYYNISEIKIVNTFGENQPIHEDFITTKILIVDLSDHATEYDLVLKGNKIDRFKVSYKETNEKCCGKTFWIDHVDFNLKTGLIDQNIGSIPIIIN